MTTAGCTCSMGMSEEERIHHALDGIFGKTEFVPKTEEQKIQEANDLLEKKKAALATKRAYLVAHNISVDCSDKDIDIAYSDTVYANMTPTEKQDRFRQARLNLNINRIMFGQPGLAYPS